MHSLLTIEFECRFYSFSRQSVREATLMDSSAHSCVIYAISFDNEIKMSLTPLCLSVIFDAGY